MICRWSARCVDDISARRAQQQFQQVSVCCITMLLRVRCASSFSRWRNRRFLSTLLPYEVRQRFIQLYVNNTFNINSFRQIVALHTAYYIILLKQWIRFNLVIFVEGRFFGRRSSDLTKHSYTYMSSIPKTSVKKEKWEGDPLATKNWTPAITLRLKPGGTKDDTKGLTRKSHPTLCAFHCSPNCEPNPILLAGTEPATSSMVHGIYQVCQVAIFWGKFRLHTFVYLCLVFILL